MLKRYPWFVLIAIALFALGCASTGGGGDSMAATGPSPEEQVTEVVQAALAALKAKDVEGMMSHYAEDFEDTQGQDKEAFGAFLTDADSQGFLDDIAIDTAEMTVTVDGDTASVAGITIEGAFGALALTFDLANRDGTWLVVGSSQG